MLRRGWHKARGQGVLFVGLHMQDARGHALRFLCTLRQDFPNVRDPTDETSRRWGATGIPETYFVSRSGDVVGHVRGTVSEQLLADGVAAALSGRPQGTGDGGAQRPIR